MPLPLDRPPQMLVNCEESARDRLLNLKPRPRTCNRLLVACSQVGEQSGQ